jgi:hypothetical protein
MAALNAQRREMERRLKNLEESKKAVSAEHAKGLQHLIHKEMESASAPDPDFAIRIAVAAADDKRSGIVIGGGGNSGNPATTNTTAKHAEHAAAAAAAAADDDDDDADDVVPTADDGLLTAAEILRRAERNNAVGDAKARQLRAGQRLDRGLAAELRPDAAFMRPYEGELGEDS